MKVLELMYESLPSLTLQLYLIMFDKSQQSSSAVTASIIAIVLNASLSLWIYLLDRSRKTDIYAANTKQSLELHNYNSNNKLEVIPSHQIVQSMSSYHEENGLNNNDDNVQEISHHSTPETSEAHQTNETLEPPVRERAPTTTKSVPVTSLSMDNVVSTSSVNDSINKSKKNSWIKESINYYIDNFEHANVNKYYFIAIYLFMCSDYYIRSFPSIVLIAIIKQRISLSIDPFNDIDGIQTNGDSILSGIIFFSYFSIVGIIELFLCRYMRIDEYKNIGYILKIFFVSVLSSFYNVLCCFKFLENDPFFGKCVVFDKHLKEHYCRMIFSIMIVIVWVSIPKNGNENEFGHSNLDIFMFILFIIFIIMNIISNYYVKKYVKSIQ